jgi:hypothetical protein
LQVRLEPAIKRPTGTAVRATLANRFDVVVVVWVLALAIGWSFYTLSRAQLTNSQWSSAPQSGPAWVVSGQDAPR